MGLCQAHATALSVRIFSDMGRELAIVLDTPISLARLLTSLESFLSGGTCRYSACNDGYQLSAFGSTSRTCDWTDTNYLAVKWDGSAKTCETEYWLALTRIAGHQAQDARIRQSSRMSDD